MRCSDWEEEHLSDDQVRYAARDALASIALCLRLATDSKVTGVDTRHAKHDERVK